MKFLKFFLIAWVPYLVLEQKHTLAGRGEMRSVGPAFRPYISAHNDPLELRELDEFLEHNVVIVSGEMQPQPGIQSLMIGCYK